jgi:hypothetical protein
VRYLRVIGWEHFQHYKNRRAPWIKAYTDQLDQLEHPTFTKLTDGAKLTLHHLRLLAGVTGNQIPETWLTSGHLNMQTKPRVTELFDAQFVVWIPESELASLASSDQKDVSNSSSTGVPPRVRGRARSQNSQDSSLSSSGEEKKNLRAGAREMVEAFAVSDHHRAWAAERVPSVDVDTATDAWRDHQRAVQYRTRQGPIADVEASWRNWMRNEVKFGRQNGNPNRRSETRTGAGGAVAQTGADHDDGLNVREYKPRSGT